MIVIKLNFNMGAFETPYLETEIVLCEMSEESKEYELMKDLYNKVEEFSNIKMIDKVQPIVHKITESFQKIHKQQKCASSCIGIWQHIKLKTSQSILELPMLN